jgi:uroporphyrinogen decarboxylase
METPAADFSQLLKVLERRKPDRPVLFEFFLNTPLYNRLAGKEVIGRYGNDEDVGVAGPTRVMAFAKAGYDYATTSASLFCFPHEEAEKKASLSINAGHTIRDRASLEAYPWLSPDDFDYSSLETLKEMMPKGMKLIVNGPCGVLENVIALTGYETLCMILYDDPKLAMDLFGHVGERLVRHYEIACRYETVGACISNDDWGFKTQTMLSPEDMRQYVFPWHKKIVDTVHAAGRPVILHSCGKLDAVMDDIIDHMGFDGKHSYEDVIEPVESAYERLGGRIAVLGGIDLDFVCRRSPEEVYERSRRMLEKAERARGAYALGTGNSVPEYTPDTNYFAMINAVRQRRGLELLR